MDSEWKSLTLQDVCSVITDGAHFSPKEDPFGLPMASVKDMTRFGIELRGCKRISESDFQTLKTQGCSPEINDVLIAKDGNSCLDTVLAYKQSDEIVLLSSVAILRPNSLVLSDYLKYFLSERSNRQYMKANFVSGSAIPRVVLKDFRRAPIQIPNLETQEKIVNIVGGLDEKIQNNHETNHTLEAMARALFKSWFVDFDPVKANAEGRRMEGIRPEVQALFPSEFEDSPLGPVPLGWEVLPIRDLVQVNSKTLGKNDILDAIDYVEISEVSLGNINNITTYVRGEEPSRARRRLQHGDTVMSTVRPDRKSYFLAWQPSQYLIASTGFAVITPKKAPWTFIHLALTQNDVFEFLGHRADGGAYPAVNPDTITEWEVCIPQNPQQLLQEFQVSVAPLLEKMEHNRQENKLLAKTRDTLLPKLLSGELDVSQLSTAVPAD